jgi:hypothetical protein
MQYALSGSNQETGKTFAGMRELLTRLTTLRAETVVRSSEQSALDRATRSLRIPEPISEELSPIP